MLREMIDFINIDSISTYDFNGHIKQATIQYNSIISQTNVKKGNC